MSSAHFAKSVSKTKAKKKAWTAFSLYLRTLWTQKGHVECYTCNKHLILKGRPGERVMVGHWVEGHANSTYINEAYVRPQCLTEESNLRLFNGKHKSIKDIRAGDMLWGFDERTFVKRACEVTKTRSFVPEELYEVELENGKKFYATGDHKVVSRNEWVEIKDMLHNVTAHDIMEL